MSDLAALSTELGATESRPRNGESREVKELKLLYRLSGILDQHPDVAQVIQPVLEALAEHMELRHGTVTLLNRKTGDILIDLAHGMSQKQVEAGRYKLGEGVTGKVVESGEPAVIPRTSESPIFLDRTRRGKSPDVSFICVPVKVGRETFGALSVDREYHADLDLDDDVRFLTIVASMIAQSVKVRRLAEEERERLHEENERLLSELRDRFQPANIIGRSHEMRHVYDQIYTVSKSNTSVLILGETG
ncbi:MAG TPA: GAF domain-containing protein, partial [Thermoanaerobaculia bacterium]|nr:GAF domain-containing protein [Thermoanaerobaculia bacterium]